MVSVRHPRLGLAPDRSTRPVVFSVGAEIGIEVAVPSLAAFHSGLAQAVSGSRGVYVLCDLPPGRRVTVGVDLRTGR